MFARRGDGSAVKPIYRHGFSMAVVVRGLIERFLDTQEHQAAD
jgi:hypothetical protein